MNKNIYLPVLFFNLCKNIVYIIMKRKWCLEDAIIILKCVDEIILKQKSQHLNRYKTSGYDLVLSTLHRNRQTINYVCELLARSEFCSTTHYKY
jgi:hypothetical protein